MSGSPIRVQVGINGMCRNSAYGLLGTQLQVCLRGFISFLVGLREMGEQVAYQALRNLRLEHI